MKRKKSLKNMDKTTKKIIILAVAFIIVIILLNSILNYLENKSKNENDNKFTSIQEILENYGCTYIKETKSKDKDYNLDIYLKFKYNTFEGNESKKRFYENIIGDLSDFIQDNFKLIDEEKKITVEVSKYNVSDNIIYSYTINGIDNYFNIEESKKILASYEDNNDENISFEINSNILKELINSDWKKDNINFGTKESTCDGYDIYFDEGIEVRTISGKVYNIVFTSKCIEPIISGITVGTDFNEIVSKLGEIQYGMQEGQYIGYRNNNIYVFFTKDTISIYRNESVEMAEFEILLEKYINSQIQLKEFMNELTYLWNDYEEYQYDVNYIYLTYPLKGIKIDMASENTLGIQIYNNCNITNKISELIEKGKIEGCLEENLIDVSELLRINKLDEYEYISELAVYESNTYNSKFYNSVIKENKILFISKDGNNPNQEINENATQGFFISDTIYIYSCEGRGIYAFNTSNGQKQNLVLGDEKYQLQSYENGTLKYDDKELKIVME